MYNAQVHRKFWGSLIALWVTCVVLLVSGEALAQPFVPDPHNMDLGVSYQYSTVTNTEERDTDVLFHVASLSVDYGLPYKLAVTASVPLVATKLAFAEFPHGPYDDGNYHATITDLQLGVRRMFLLGENFVVTPSFNLVTPLHNYPQNGHAAPGRGLIEAQFGIDVAYLPSFSQKVFFSGQFLHREGER